MTKKIEIKLDDTARDMIYSLREAARQNDVSLEGLTVNNFNSFLDDAFNDGGEVRCEQFTDLAIDYALQFGQLESRPFNVAQWKAIEKAFKILRKGM